MEKLKRILSLMNIIQYIMAFYELFIAQNINLGLCLTLVSFALTVIILWHEKLDKITTYLNDEYKGIVLNKVATKYCVIITISFFITCFVFFSPLGKFEEMFRKNDYTPPIANVCLLMLWIGCPVIYTLLSMILKRLTQNTYRYGSLQMLAVYLPSILICIHLIVHNGLESFDIEDFIGLLVIILPSLICSIVLYNKLCKKKFQLD